MDLVPCPMPCRDPPPARAAGLAVLLPALAVTFAATALTPRAAVAQTVPLFPAHNVFTSSPATAVFGTRLVLLRCRKGDTASIESPGGNGGVIVDNFLTDNGVNLCLGKGGPSNSCFSQAINPTPGTPANAAYKGVGSIPLIVTPGVTAHTFRLQDAGVVGANNRLVLRTSCKTRILRPRRGGSGGGGSGGGSGGGGGGGSGGGGGGG